MAKKWIGDAVKRPGAVKDAAARKGKSVAEEAKSEAKSPDSKIAARGRLALRFKGMAKKGNIRKGGNYKRHWSQKKTGAGKKA